MNDIIPTGFYKLKSDLCLNCKDEAILKAISELTEEKVYKILKNISIVSSSGLIVRDISMFKMRYGIGCDKIHMHKVIAGKHNLSYKLSFYSVSKVLRTFKKHLIQDL